MSFGHYIKVADDGARKSAATLGRLMPNVSGPRQCKRRLLMSVIDSRLLYGAQVWADNVQHVHRCLMQALDASGSKVCCPKSIKVL